jgi:uncharacterized protein YacL
VWTVGLLGGALAGLITCQATGLILRYYAIARLPEESDAGHRFSVNVEVLGIAAGLLFGSLMITLLIAMRLSQRALALLSANIHWLVLAIVVALGTCLGINRGGNYETYLILLSIWVVLHGCCGLSAG